MKKILTIIVLILIVSNTIAQIHNKPIILNSKLTKNLNVVSAKSIILKPGFHAPKSIRFSAKVISQQEFIKKQQNYIVSKTYTDKTGNNALTKINYFDGLGRPIQNVQVGSSPQGNDIIQHIAYDNLGRESRKYLPYTAGTGGYFHKNAEQDQLKFYESFKGNSNATIAGTSQPWSDIVFENSPLNRVLEQGAPGETWKAETGDNSTDHSTHFSYGTNDNNEVILFEVKNENKLYRKGYYKKNTLYKTGTRDENRVWTHEYKNLQGQILLKVSDPDGLNLRTYYVFDDYGSLRYTLPPKAVEILSKTPASVIDTSNAIIKNLCYYYQYDYRRRMIIKKIPGADPVYMVYDKRDRLVLTQDGNLRKNNKWMFTKYDHFNRFIMTGVYLHGELMSQSKMQTLVNTKTNYYETKSGNYSDSNFGYTNQSFPVLDNNDIILTVSYYDNYNFDANNNIRNLVKSYNQADVFPASEINYAVKGQVTGGLIKILGENAYLLTANFYDDKYRLLRTYTENYFGGYDVLLNKIDFLGNILQTRQIHKKDQSNNSVIVDQRFTYDHAFRLKKVYHKVGDSPEICIIENEYNVLGQLIKKSLHKETDNRFLQEIDYRYNIRGWLSSINNPEQLQQTGEPKDLFAMQLGYDNNFGLTSKKQYNGNISSMKWKNAVVENLTEQNRAYAFNYDSANRLKKGTHYKNNKQTSAYTLNNVNYDANGNIKNLTRYGATGIIDNLTYNYNTSTGYSNQLQKVDDAATVAGFADVAGQDYSYDCNGNLTRDNNKQISQIHYNYLNLPSEIDFGSGNKIRYIYDAVGVKHAKKVVGNIQNNQYYIGNMEYDNNKELKYIHTSEGRVRFTGSDIVYDYYLKDHLGNTRVVFSAKKTGGFDIEQIDNYYPFGMRFNQANLLNNQTTNYLYNGKELQQDYNLNWYDYGARFYDAALGRFPTIDPLAETYNFQSPYVYAANDPIKYIDVNGMGPGTLVKLIKKAAQSGQKYLARTSNGGLKPVSQKSAQQIIKKGGSVISTGKAKTAKQLYKSTTSKKVVRHGGHKLDNGKTGLDHYQKKAGDGTHAYYAKTVTTVAGVSAATAASASDRDGSSKFDKMENIINTELKVLAHTVDLTSEDWVNDIIKAVVGEEQFNEVMGVLEDIKNDNWFIDINDNGDASVVTLDGDGNLITYPLGGEEKEEKDEFFL